MTGTQGVSIAVAICALCFFTDCVRKRATPKDNLALSERVDYSAEQKRFFNDDYRYAFAHRNGYVNLLYFQQDTLLIYSDSLVKKLVEDNVWKLYCIYFDQPLFNFERDSDLQKVIAISTIGETDIRLILFDSSNDYRQFNNTLGMKFAPFIPGTNISLLGCVDYFGVPEVTNNINPKYVNRNLRWLQFDYIATKRTFIWKYRDTHSYLYFSDSNQVANTPFERFVRKRLANLDTARVRSYLQEHKLTCSKIFYNAAARKGILNKADLE